MLLLLTAASTYLDSYTTNCSAVKTQYKDQCCGREPSSQFSLDTPWVPNEWLEQMHTPSGGWTAEEQYEGLDVPPSKLYAVDAALPDMRGLWKAESAEQNGNGVPVTPHLKRVEQIGKRTTIVATGIVHDCVADTFDGRVHDVSNVDYQTEIEVLCVTKNDQRGPVLVHVPLAPFPIPDGGIERWIERVGDEDYLVQSRPPNQQLQMLAMGLISSSQLVPIITRYRRVAYF